MSELRKDPIVGRWVIISTERGKRPSEFVVELTPSRVGFCPFCPTNEDKTPPEIMAYRKDNSPPNTPGWSLRVVPNKFPALRVEGELERYGDGVYDKMNGIGAHEVIIESPEHEETLSSMAESSFEDVLWSYRDRIIDLKRDKRLKYVLVFKNYGEEAGATLEHSHSQIIALPIVPKLVNEEINGSLSYYNYKERCIFCDIIRQEIQQNTRIVSENKDFLSIAPYAPRTPFETWILPKRHSSAFENIYRQECGSLAQIFRDVLQRIDRVLNKPPYNFMLHTSPLNHRECEYFHWHFEIMPKLTKVAGFEWGSGFYINPTPPEEAAAFLKDAVV